MSYPLVKYDRLWSEINWGDPRPRGDPFGHKTPHFWDIKLQIFGAEGTENFEKFRVFKEKSAILEFKGKFGQILIDIVILNYFGCKNNSFFRF